MDQETIGKELQKFNVTDAAIAELSTRYMGLTIKDIEDKEGYKKVHEARMDVKGRRVSVQKTGEELRADAVKFQKTVIDEQKRIIGLLAPIEAHLDEEETRIDNEKAAIKAAEEKLLAVKIQERVDRICAYGAIYNGKLYVAHGILIMPAIIKEANDQDFDALIAQIQAEKDAEDAKNKAAESARKVEEERLKKIAADQEAERQRLAEAAKKQEEEAARIKADQETIEKARQTLIEDEAARLKAIGDERNRVTFEKVRAAELENVRIQAIEQARIDVEAKIKRQVEEKAAADLRAKIAAEKKEARRPDKAKLKSYINTIFSIPEPEMKTEEGKAVQKRIDEALESMNASMNAWIEEL